MNAAPAHRPADTGSVSNPRRERRPVDLPAFATRQDGSLVEMSVVDLSYDGCGVACAGALNQGERLTLSVLRRGKIPAEVRWVRGGKAGLSFQTDGDQERYPTPRQHERVSVEGQVTMRRSGKLNFKVHVYDLSSKGCKAEFVERPELGEQLWIKFEGIDALEAEVRWIIGAKTGVHFARPIHPAVFDLLLERLR
jgi:hypothetical protein